MFEIGLISENRWVCVLGENSFYSSDEFVDFLQHYEKKLGGSVEEVSRQIQYRIDVDPLRLVFQWDSCFGISVVVPPEVDMAVALNVLQELCDELNATVR